MGVYYNELEGNDRSYSYIYKDLNGKTCRISTGKKSNGITEVYTFNERAKTINMLKNGSDPLAHKKKKSVLLFKDVWEYYIENKALSDKVRADYKGRWTKHMEFYFSQSVSFQGLKDFRADKQKTTLSARSIDMMIAVVGTAIEFWNTKQRRNSTNKEATRPLFDNPVPMLREEDRETITKTDLQKRKVTRERYLSAEEIQTLFAALDEKPELLLFVVLSLSTGGRLGTICKIQKKHINGDKVTLINEKVGGKTYMGFLNSHAKKLLQPLLETIEDNDFAIQLEQRPLQRRLQRILNNLFNTKLKANDRVNRVMIHTLRHTFASALVAKGTSIAIVQKLLDHAKIETTMRYSHLAPDAGIDAVMELWG